MVKIPRTKLLITSQGLQVETACQMEHIQIRRAWNFLMLHLAIGIFSQVPTIHHSPPRVPEIHLALPIMETILASTLFPLYSTPSMHQVMFMAMWFRAQNSHLVGHRQDSSWIAQVDP